jgi:hypothetical protein
MWHVTFMHPAALWLATAAVLPLVIHLLSRQKARLIRFPAVRFIRLSQHKSFRRTRFRHLLLLLLRMALIGAFAVLIARPAFSRSLRAIAETGADGTPAAVLILDDSLSMNYLAGDMSWFDIARNRALEAVQRLPEGTAAAVLVTSQPKGKLERELAGLAGRIQALRPSTRASVCWEALETASQMLRQTGASRRDVLLFTDMTASAWLGRDHRVVDMGREVNLFISDCSTHGASNGAVTELRQEGEPPMLGAVLGLKARLVASGGPQARTVQFEFDGTTLEQRTLELAAGEESTLLFRVPLTEGGHHWGRVRFLNPDALPQDDARTFAVEVAPDTSVLCVEDELKDEATSASHFLRLALDPWGDGRRSMFRLERTTPERLEQVPLGPFDVVVLAGAGRMTPSAWRRLEAYVGSGGGLLAFAGPETGAAYADEAAVRLLGAEVGEELVAPPESPFRMRVLDADQPLMAALKEAGAELGEARFRQCRRLRPAEGSEELVSFGPDLPALVMRRGAGKVAVFAGTADERWGDFAMTPAFLPFCHEMALYLAGRAAESIKSFTIGAHVPIQFEPSRWPTIVYVTAPGARSPERLVPGTTPGVETYWKTEQPGYYRVSFEQHDQRWQSGFAVNTVPAESRLEKVSLDDVRQSVHAGAVEALSEVRLDEGGVGRQARPGELTPYVALLALLMLMLEGFLANRFYSAERT